MDPPLTTVRQPLPEIAEAAIGCLLARIQGGKQQDGARQITIAPELIRRQSTRSIAQESA